jgi:hypothetical protein
MTGYALDRGLADKNRVFLSFLVCMACTSMDNPISMAITIERLRTLPIELRVALVASIVERVLRLYSHYFRTTYKGDEAIELAWDFALGRPVPGMRPFELNEEVADLTDQAEDDGYSTDELLMTACLLSETYTDDGKSALGAIDYAAICYGKCAMQRQNIGGMLPIGFVDRVGEPVYRMAEAMLEFAERNLAQEVRRDLFKDFVIVDEQWTPEAAAGFPGERIFVAAASAHEK